MLTQPLKLPLHAHAADQETGAQKSYFQWVEGSGFDPDHFILRLDYYPHVWPSVYVIFSC